MRSIAILLTNTDRSDFARSFPNDAQRVRQLLQAVRPDWNCVEVALRDGEPLPAVDAHDGHVITGSPASVNDTQWPWLPALLDFIRAAHAKRWPLVGLCFGHQAVAKALGGEVKAHPGGWGLGVAQTEWTVQRDWMNPPCPDMPFMHLNAAHIEQVTRVPEGAQVISRSPFCPVGALQIGSHILTTQYHPEMPLVFMQGLLDQLASRVDGDTLAKARLSLQQANDAPVMAQWMAQFFEQAWKAHS